MPHPNPKSEPKHTDDAVDRAVEKIVEDIEKHTHPEGLTGVSRVVKLAEGTAERSAARLARSRGGAGGDATTCAARRNDAGTGCDDCECSALCAEDACAAVASVKKDERTGGVGGHLSTLEGEPPTLALPYRCARFDVFISGPRPGWCHPCSFFCVAGRGPVRYACAHAASGWHKFESSLGAESNFAASSRVPVTSSLLERRDMPRRGFEPPRF